MLRVPLLGQGKAHAEGNGRPFPRGATRHWPNSRAPCGPVHESHRRRYDRLNQHWLVLRSPALSMRLVNRLSVTELPAWPTGWVDKARTRRNRICNSHLSAV